MVYAQLIHTQLAAVLNFLSSVPGPSGESALHFVMTQWVAREHLFYGAYEKKVFVVALAKLLQHGVNNNDTRLQEVTVRGDQILNEVARTRSEKKINPDQWTNVPLLVKIFKILVCEVSNHVEDAFAGSTEAGGDLEDSEAEEEEWEEDENGMAASNPESAGNHFKAGGTELSRLLSTNHDGFDEDEDDEDEDDPDALADPLYRLNIRQYLKEFIVEFCKQPYFLPHFAQHLNVMEKKGLVSIGINP
jgi:hypothetical protein